MLIAPTGLEITSWLTDSKISISGLSHYEQIKQQPRSSTRKTEYSNALQGSLEGGREMTVKLLLHRGADVNAHGGAYGRALQMASAFGMV